MPDASRTTGTHDVPTQRLRGGHGAAVASEDRLRSHVEASPFAVIEWDESFVVTRWAGAAERMFGWSAADTVGRSVGDLGMVYEDDVPVVQRVMAQLTDGVTSQLIVSNRNYTRDRRVVECTWHNSVLRDAKGRMTSVLSLVEDVTERRRDELNARFLIEFGRNIAQIPDATEIVATALRRLGEHLGVQTAVLADLDLASDVWAVRHEWSAGGHGVTGTHALADFLPPGVLSALAAGHTVAVDDVAHDRRTTPGVPSCTPSGMAAFAIAPHHSGGRVVAALAVGAAAPREWRADETQLLREVVARVWPAFDRLRTIAALQESETRLRLAESAAGLGIFDYDLASGTLRWDDRVREIWGLPPTGPNTYAQFLKGLHRDDRGALSAALARVLDASGDGRHAGEYRVVGREDGATRWVAVTGQAFRSSPTGVRLIGTVQDVTERKQAEQQVAESEERFRKVFEHAVTGIAITDGDGNFEQCNPAYCALLGYTNEDLRQLVFADLVHPEDRGDDLAAIQRLRSGEVPFFEIENRYVRKDGASVWVHKFVSVLGDQIGAPAHFVALVTDVTERRRADAALRESEARFRVMADETPVLIWAHDASGGIQFVNRHYCDYFGVTGEQVRGPNWQPLVHPEDGAYLEAFAASLRTHTPFRAEARVRRADGEWRWVASHGTPRFSSTNEFLGLVGSSYDITDQKRAAQLERESARQKDEFIAVLAHELRNPLAPIRTSVGVLRAHGPADPVLVRCRDVIDRQVANMSRLLDDLLDVSRLTRGQLRLQRTRVQLADIVEAAVETSRPLVDQQHQELAVHAASRPIEVEADAPRLTQVLANLLNNAAKYGNPGSRIDVFVDVEGDLATVRVRDRGIGIPPEMLDRVFDLFTQVEAASSRASGGLGIGLSLARRLVEMHGGTIEASSEGLGHGSTFTVRLPTVSHGDTHPRRPEAGPARHAVPPPRRVLVADDNVDAAEMLATLLGSFGCDVRAAYDGESAVREAGEFLPDLVLLDIGMPGVDGHEACRRIRRQPWGTGMVLVALTGWGQEEDRRRSLTAGFDQHIVKPIDPEALVRLVHDLQPRRI